MTQTVYKGQQTNSQTPYYDNEELLPSQDKDRVLSLWDIIMLCAGMVVNVVGLVIPAQILLRGAYNPLEILLACLFGFLLVSILIILTGDIGIRYGLPFTVVIRDCLGKKGALLGSLLRAVVCMTWTGVLLFFGTEAINTILVEISGISAFWLVFVLFAAAQLFNASRNVKAMSRVSWLAMPVMALGIMLLIIWLLRENDLNLPAIIGASPLPGDGFPFITIIAIFSGGWLSEALNGSDLSRKIKIPAGTQHLPFFKRNSRTMIGFSVGFIVTGLLLSFAGLVCGYITGEADPVKIIQSAFEHNPLILIFSCFIIVIAQWSTNTVANIFPATLIFLNAFPKLSFAKATWLVGLISCIMMPWIFANYLDYVQIIFSAMLAPLLGIMLTHYYFVRKGKINVAHLYGSKLKDWNISGLIALGIGIAIGAILYNWAFFAAFPAAAFSYFILASWFSGGIYNERDGENRQD